MDHVSVYEAKTHLSRLLDAVEVGEEVVITRIAKWVEYYNGTRPSSPDSSAYIDKEP